MTTINLRDHYPSFYNKDKYIDVPDDVAQFLKDSESEQKAYEEYIRYHKAFYSLDCEDNIETEAIHRPKEPLEIILEQELSEQMRQALAGLTPTDRRRFIYHTLGKISKSDIARQENVTEGAVRKSIERAKTYLREKLKKY